jgi:hypothetical protein
MINDDIFVHIKPDEDDIIDNEDDSDLENKEIEKISNQMRKLNYIHLLLFFSSNTCFLFFLRILYISKEKRKDSNKI